MMVLRIVLMLALCGAWVTGVVTQACAAGKPSAPGFVGGAAKNKTFIGGPARNIGGFRAAAIQRRH